MTVNQTAYFHDRASRDCAAIAKTGSDMLILGLSKVIVRIVPSLSKIWN